MFDSFLEAMSERMAGLTGKSENKKKYIGSVVWVMLHQIARAWWDKVLDMREKRLNKDKLSGNYV